MRNTLWTVLAGLSIASAAQAATVTFNIATNPTAGTFTVTMTDTTDANNFGIAAYGFTLSSFATMTNTSPQVRFNDVNGDEQAQAGFTETRSANNVNPAGAGQALAGGDTIYIYGIGQRAGTLLSVAPAGTTPNSVTRVTYTNPVVIATGTYTGTVPTIVTSQANYFFTQPANNGTPTVLQAASVATSTTVPEPTLVGVAGLTLVGLVRRRRATV